MGSIRVYVMDNETHASTAMNRPYPRDEEKDTVAPVSSVTETPTPSPLLQGGINSTCLSVGQKPREQGRKEKASGNSQCLLFKLTDKSPGHT